MLITEGMEAEEIARHLHDLNAARQHETSDMLMQAQETAMTWDFHVHRVLMVCR